MEDNKRKKESKKYTYFMETHLSNEEENIQIFIPSENKFIYSFEKIYHKGILREKEYVCSIFKVGTKVIEANNTNIELKIILRKDDTNFESKNNIDLKSNNFLGLIKFEDYKGWLSVYKPPEIYNLSKYEIFSILNEVIFIKEKIKYNDNLYYEFINYGFNLYDTCTQNKFELFIILYIDILNGDNYSLIEKIFGLFYIENKYEKNLDYLFIYLDSLENIYKRQNEIFEKFIFYISNKSLTYNLEFYLKKFYTIYIYILNLLEDNNKIEFILKNLSDNKFDNLILPKLYLTEYHAFYDGIQISKEIELIIANKLFEASITYSDLITSFALISKYVNKDFEKILAFIINNYDKINNICVQSKKEIKIMNYIKQNIKDNLTIIRENIEYILTKKKENNFKSISFSIDIFLFYIKKVTNIEFLCFLEDKLFENSIDFEDIENYLIFSSIKRNNRLIPILELLLNKYDKINLLSKKENKKIILANYIQPNIEDDLMRSKYLINDIVEKQKKYLYKCIKFEAKIFEFYSNIDDLATLKIIQSIIDIINEIDSIDEETINLSKKIHKVGMNMIKKGEMENDEIFQFLKEDELLYNNERIDDLKSATNFLYRENNYLKIDISMLQDEIKIKNQEIKDLKREISDLNDKVYDLNNKLRDSNDKVKDLNDKINSALDDIKGLKFDNKI